MLTIRTVALLLALVACGSSGGPSGSDGQPAHGDAAPPTVDDVQCQIHTFTETRANGSKTVSDSKFALVPNIDPGSFFTVESCDEIVTVNGVASPITSLEQSCPAGSTCQSSGTAFPPFTHLCTDNSVGTFVDDKLFVSCGNTLTDFDTTGTMISKTDISYGAVRVRH